MHYQECRESYRDSGRASQSTASKTIILMELSTEELELTLIQLLGDECASSVARLYLRPGDRMCNPILSNNVSTNNILLQVTVPKRTGRKRKRGSLGPYQDAVDNAPKTPEGTVQTTKDTQYLLDSMSANVGKYHIHPVGLIEQTHRFRSKWLDSRHVALDTMGSDTRH